MAVDVAWVQKEGIAIAQISGRIDSGSASGFQEALESGLHGDNQILVLDFEQVNYISSAGLRVIVSIAKQLRGEDVKLALCSLSKQVYEVFSVSGFDQLIAIRASQAEAIGELDESDRQEQEEEAVAPAGIESSFDTDIIADNMRDIASFTIEKYEFRHDRTLPDDVREEAKRKIERALSQRVENMQQLRQRILSEMFTLADDTLDDIVGGKG